MDTINRDVMQVDAVGQPAECFVYLDAELETYERTFEVH